MKQSPASQGNDCRSLFRPRVRGEERAQRISLGLIPVFLTNEHISLFLQMKYFKNSNLKKNLLFLFRIPSTTFQIT